MEVQKLLKRVEKDDIEFITLQFTDLLGLIKEVVISADQLEDACRDGMWFDGSSVEGFARIQESDLFLKPVPSTYATVPWLTEGGKTARLICDIYQADGKPFEGDPRFILKKVIKETNDKGYEFYVGPEPEFYLFKLDQHQRTNPLDYEGYFDLSSHSGYSVMKEIISAMDNFGIEPETSHHEVGHGQYEIDFKYGKALDTADKVLTLKYCTKRVAQMHNLHATFMAKPIMNMPGNGMHIHQSLFDMKTDTNVFWDEGQRFDLSKTALNFIAGQIRHIKAASAVLCPTINSYKRLVSGYEAPVYISWAAMNRSALLRIPRWFKSKKSSARIELRSPDATCNPYLAFAVMLKAGLDGIENELTPPEPVEENIYQLDSESIADKQIDTLPTSLLQALNELKQDDVMKDTLGEHLFEKYVDIKNREWDEFKKQVTSWELRTYLDTF